MDDMILAASVYFSQSAGISRISQVQYVQLTEKASKDTRNSPFICLCPWVLL